MVWNLWNYRIIFLAITLFYYNSLFAGSIPVRNIQVDVKGKTALEARETALIKARQLAFSKLMAENPAYGINTTDGVPPDQVLESLVDDYEILREKMSNIRYIGTFNINFNDRALQKYLAGPRRLVNPQDSLTKDLESDSPKVPSGRYVVIPIYVSADSSFLWEENNPWSRYWVAQETKNKGKIGSNIYTIPLGDLRDILALTIEDALVAKTQPISSIIERYQAEVALVVVLRSLDDGMNSHEMQVKIFTRAGLQQASEPLTLQGQSGVSIDDIFKAAAQKAFSASGGKEEMVSAGFEQMPLEGSPAVRAIAVFNTFQDWQAIRQSLSKCDFIESVDVINLNRQQAELMLKSRVSQSALTSKLAEIGISLENVGGKARLSLLGRPHSHYRPAYKTESPFSTQPLNEEEDFISTDADEEAMEPPEVIE